MKVTVIIPVWNQEDLIQRAIRSVPDTDDVELIVIDDCSTDRTGERIQEIRKEGRQFFHFTNQIHMGVAYTVNRGYDYAQGEYVVVLGSDDYFLKFNFLKALYQLDGTDMVYFDLEVNDGTVWHVTQKNRREICGSVKFIRRKFLGASRCPEDKMAGEDKVLNERLLAKDPTEKFTGIRVKHYNFPREGSLSDLARKGIIPL